MKDGLKTRNETEAKKALAKCEEKYRGLFDNTPHAILVADVISGRIVDANKAAAELWKIPRDKLIGMHQSELHPEKDKERCQDQFTRHTISNEYRSSNLPIRRSDGSTTTVEVLSTKFNSEGRVLVHGVFRDISWQIGAEENEQKFLALAEHLDMGVFIHQSGKFLYVNRLAEEITGYSRAELLEMDFWELIHPDSRDLVRRRGLSRIGGERVQDQYSFKIVPKDGREQWVDLTATVIELGGEAAVLGTIRNVTDKNRAE